MSISYDVFTEAFLAKVTEYDFAYMPDYDKITMVDGYMKRAFGSFRHVSKYDFDGTANDCRRVFELDVPRGDLVEIVDIISEGMVVQWLNPMLNRQDNLENKINTRDFTTYSAANLLMRIREVYSEALKRFTNMVRAYSYHHGDLTDLHI